MTTAVINKIIPFSSVDGPGNRTAIFLQGCNINCRYCHNPETRGMCTGCGVCVDRCPAGALRFLTETDSGTENAQRKPSGRKPAGRKPAGGACIQSDAPASARENGGTFICGTGHQNDVPASARENGAGEEREFISRGRGQILWDPLKCCQCDTCIHVCPHDSSPRTAVMTPEQVYAKVKKQIPYIRGISVSGGECMLHPEFLTELFTLAKADGLGTLIDSNGTIDFEPLTDLMAVTDGVMLDIKAFDRKMCMDVTGHPNGTVLKNAAYLGENEKLEEVRFVIVPDLYDVRQSVTDAGKFLKPYDDLHPFLIKLIAFRPMGVREQYRRLRVPSAALMQELEQILRAQGYGRIVQI